MANSWSAPLPGVMAPAMSQAVSWSIGLPSLERFGNALPDALGFG